MNTRDILAIEGEWQDDNLRHTENVASALRFLQEVSGIDFVHRRVPTREAFLKYLEWGTAAKFRILYLCGHGYEGGLVLGSEQDGTVTLEMLEETLRGKLGREGIVVHFGTCFFMKAGLPALRRFKQATKARLVSGYTTDVDFVDSMLLDLAYFRFLQRKGSFDDMDTFLKGRHSKLAKELGFMVI